MKMTNEQKNIVKALFIKLKSDVRYCVIDYDAYNAGKLNECENLLTYIIDLMICKKINIRKTIAHYYYAYKKVKYGL